MEWDRNRLLIRLQLCRLLAADARRHALVWKDKPEQGPRAKTFLDCSCQRGSWEDIGQIEIGQIGGRCIRLFPSERGDRPKGR